MLATINMGAILNKQPAPGAAAININHPEQWVADAAAIAKADVYAAPFNTAAKNVDPSAISTAYHDRGVVDIDKQIFIAGWRLATTLNTQLQGWSGA
ncbi:hypothetical protein [Granulicella arctica]|uniref:hypothetical protein n=1 Tax=Granulicella arctica TaxID=940613 RepID=UPI0037C05F84